MKQLQNRPKIGIPTTLFASYNLSYWRDFITNLGMEVVYSDESTEKTADLGGRLLPPEFCIPIKVFMGHILNLLDKKVDQILLPRMTDLKKTNFFCPKLIGLPDIVRLILNIDESRLLTPEVICNGLNPRVIKGPSFVFTSQSQINTAEKQAQECWRQTLARCRNQKLTLPEATVGLNFQTRDNPIRVGLLGYAYSLYDPFISKGVNHKLAKLKISVTTCEMLDPKLIEASLAGLKRPLFWNFGRMILGAGVHFLKDTTIDGIIYVTTFGCGPDSVVSEILRLEAGENPKPLLLINLDEHTEDGHLFTRLEAFTDMLATLKEDKAV